MPSEKRARQRAARDQKVAEQQKAKKQRRLIRRTIAGVFLIGVIVLIVFLLHGNGSKPAAVTTTTTTATGSSTSTSTTPTSSTTPATSSTKPTGPTLPSVPPTTAVVAKTPIAPKCPPATAAGAPKRVIDFSKAPGTCISDKDIYKATFVTDAGTFVVTMNPKTSLAAVNNFVFLARYHFFDGIIFHRVIPGFVVQGGDPTGTGDGGPGYSWTGNVPPKGCTAKKDCYETGSIAMANSSGPSTNGSQFFLVLPGGASVLNGEPNYTNFGQVTSGMNVVEKLGAYGSSSGTPTAALYMTKVTITQIPG